MKVVAKAFGKLLVEPEIAAPESRTKWLDNRRSEMIAACPLEEADEGTNDN